ncbi:hypothetical protein EJ110_NYTH01629 [Nymphaea thermarum]|nr:hypothetical protein EJ110_NYTH01629 [Nymphaea thermarum]
MASTTKNIGRPEDTNGYESSKVISVPNFWPPLAAATIHNQRPVDPHASDGTSFFGRNGQSSKEVVPTFTMDEYRKLLSLVRTPSASTNFAVPEWWFSISLICVVGLAFLACLGFGGQLQLPWWGILLACAIAFFFTLPRIPILCRRQSFKNEEEMKQKLGQIT